MASLDAEMNRLIREKCRQERDRGMTAIAKTGKQMMLQRRRDVTAAWFGEFSSVDINAKGVLQCVPEKVNISMQRGAVNLATFIDVAAYTEKPKAEAWREKYGGNTDPKEYVLRLQLYYGIIGLPEKAKARPDSDWENKDPHIKEPLIGVLYRELTNDKFLKEIVLASGLSTEPGKAGG